MWSALNVLPNSLKISDLTNKDLFQLNFFRSMESCDKSVAMVVYLVFNIREHVDSPRVF